MDPDWALTVHPETALAARDTALVNGTIQRVSLIQNEAFYGLRHPLVYEYSYTASSHRSKLLIIKVVAPRHGFEPRFTAPKAAVLPLDDRGKQVSAEVLFPVYVAQRAAAMIWYDRGGS